MKNRFHIFSKRTDEKALCGNKNRITALFIDASGYSPADFFKRCWRGYRFKNRCQHCEKIIKSKGFTYS